MSELEKQNPQQNPRPLDYQVPQGPPQFRFRIEHLYRASALLAGLVIGGLLMIAIGLHVGTRTARGSAFDFGPGSSPRIAIGFVVIGAIFLLAPIWVFLRCRSAFWMFIAGVFIGCGILGLIDGLCFWGK